MTFADSSLVKGFLSAAKTDWPITPVIIKRKHRMSHTLRLPPRLLKD